MKAYRAVQPRDTTGCVAAVVEDGREPRPLVEYRYDGKRGRYVPGDNGGFAYGYGGTGPANLARAIVADLLGAARINREDGNALVQTVKRRLVAPVDQQLPLEVDEAAVRTVVAAYEADDRP